MNLDQIFLRPMPSGELTFDNYVGFDGTPPIGGLVSSPTSDIVVTIDGTDYPGINNGDGTWTLPDDTITPALGPGTYPGSVTSTEPGEPTLVATGTVTILGGLTAYAPDTALTAYVAQDGLTAYAIQE